MPSQPRVSAVIVNYNARDHLVACIRSLRDDGVEEVVVVDNASSDGSLDAAGRADPAAVLVPTGGNLGFGAAANRGLAVASGEYVVVMNPDVVVEPGTMKVLVDAADRHPRIAVLGPRVENPDGTFYPSARTFPDLDGGRGVRARRGNLLERRVRHELGELAAEREAGAAADLDPLDRASMLRR